MQTRPAAQYSSLPDPALTGLGQYPERLHHRSQLVFVALVHLQAASCEHTSPSAQVADTAATHTRAGDLTNSAYTLPSFSVIVAK